MNKAEILKEHYSAMGKKGSKNRWAKTTPEERSEYARQMVKARWAKKLSPGDVAST
jgi:hypothetical protein